MVGCPLPQLPLSIQTSRWLGSGSLHSVRCLPEHVTLLPPTSPQFHSGPREPRSSNSISTGASVLVQRPLTSNLLPLQATRAPHLPRPHFGRMFAELTRRMTQQSNGKHHGAKRDFFWPPYQASKCKKRGLVDLNRRPAGACCCPSSAPAKPVRFGAKIYESARNFEGRTFGPPHQGAPKPSETPRTWAKRNRTRAERCLFAPLPKAGDQRPQIPRRSCVLIPDWLI